MCTEVPDGAILTKFGRAAEVTYVMTCANLFCNQLRGVDSGVAQNLPFLHHFTGRPYNRQALACCRD